VTELASVTTFGGRSRSYLYVINCSMCIKDFKVPC